MAFSRLKGSVHTRLLTPQSRKNMQGKPLDNFDDAYHILATLH